jgi:hypothetical protein
MTTSEQADRAEMCFEIGWLTTEASATGARGGTKVAAPAGRNCLADGSGLGAGSWPSGQACDRIGALPERVADTGGARP